MLTAITRDVSPAIGRCELTCQEREPIDIALARTQHEVYRAALAGLGVRVVNLPATPGLPDCTFVEDPAIVLDELAVITRPGARSRRAECRDLEAALSRFRRTLLHITEPATLEGGDVVRLGRDLYVGLSSRSNPDGIRQLHGLLAPHGYRVIEVGVRGCLHLKSASCLRTSVT